MRNLALPLALTAACAQNTDPSFTVAGGTDAGAADRPMSLDLGTIVPHADAGSSGTCAAGHNTHLTGHALAPNGTDPLPGIRVYLVAPSQTFPPAQHAVTCQHCSQPPSALASTLSNPDGSFDLYGSVLDAGGTFSVVFESGLFRRVAHGVTVAPCSMQALPAAMTKFAGAASGDDTIPRIAVAGYRTAPATTHNIDVNDRFTHVLDLIGITQYDTVDPDKSGSNGGTGTDLLALLASPTMLAQYQMLITPCGVLGNFTPSMHLAPAMITNLQAWLAAGGRLYASDLAYPVIQRAFPAGINFAMGMPTRGEPADIGVGLATGASLAATVDEPGLRAWLQQVGAIAAGASTLPVVDLKDPWGAMDSLPSAELMAGTGGHASGLVWVSGDVSWHAGPAGPHHHPLTAQADFPGPDNGYCGRVVFTSYHVQSDTTAMLSPQERILEYLFFQLSTCIDIPG